MSRIQKAIEKAAQLRQAPGQEEATVVMPPDVSLSQRPVVQRQVSLPAPSPEAPVPNHPLFRSILEGNGVVAEQFRKLQGEISKRTRGENFRNSLLITSSISGEGKTVIALSLAIALAQGLDHTVLLVDADLRRPMVHEYLGLQPTVGLIQCLTGEAKLEDALVRTGIGKLVVLPAGGRLENPVELLASAKMKALVEELKSRYPDRYVLFDGTPVLLFAEPRALAGMMDGVLYVVREGVSQNNQVEQGVSVLEDVPIMGLAYNDTSMDLSGKGYYGYYNRSTQR